MAKAKTAPDKDQALVEEWKKRLGERRWIYERTWWGNILFYLGQQWVTFDPLARRWRHRKISPSVPQPVTNLFRATLDTVKSAVAQHDPRFLGTPRRDDPRAVAAAAAVDAHIGVILKEGRFKVARRRMLDWLLLTGNAIVENVWNDGEETGVEAVPLEQCQQCLAEYKPQDLDPNAAECPECGGMLAESDKAIYVPRGEMRFDPLSPFEFWIDPMIEELEDQPGILTVQSFTPEQVTERWEVDLEGSQQTETSTMNREGIAAVAGLPGQSGLAELGGGSQNKRVVVYRLFVKRCKEYKDGVYIAMTSDGKLLEKKAPYPWRKRQGEGQKFYPFTHFRFGTVGGRAWGFTPADDLLPKQYQLNKAESLFQLIMTRMANPVWLIPTNTNPTRITGEIGIQIEYTPVGSAAPTRVPGAEAPASLVKYIEDIRNSFDELSGAFAAVRGRSLGSRTPVGTVQTLQERGFGRWATVFQGLEEGYEELARKGLEIWRQNAHTPRVMAVRNALGGYTFSELQAADWDDGVDVEVEAGSSRPKSQTEKMQFYMELGQTGVLDFTDESQKLKMLEDIGMINMKPGVEEDSKAAYRENAEFMQWAQRLSETALAVPLPEVERVMAEAMAEMPIEVQPIVDDHSVHFLTHRRLCLTDDFKRLPPQIKEVMLMHMMLHQRDLPLSKMNMNVAAMLSGAGQQPGQGKPGAGPGGGTPNAAPTKEIGGGESNPDKDAPSNRKSD